MQNPFFTMLRRQIAGRATEKGTEGEGKVRLLPVISELDFKVTDRSAPGTRHLCTLASRKVRTSPFPSDRSENETV